MKKTIFFIVLATLCLNFLAKAQINKSINNLQVGDAMPNVQINNILNSRIKSANISAFKGKLIILDFWSTWCSSCIDSFAELDSLQREFKGHLQVFLVNPKREGDTERGVRMVISRMNAWSNLPFKLPVVYGDTSITKYFVFHSIPHCVWIGPNGNVIGITAKEEVTSEHIRRVISGEVVKFIPKNK